MQSKNRIKESAWSWFFELDRILRGEATKFRTKGKAEIKIPVLGISVVVIVLAVVYGFCMGIFALVHGIENGTYQRAYLQTFASMCKVPLLFGLTLLITFPSLYVFNALVGSQLRILPVLKLLIASLAVNLAVLASLGPIVAFFSVSTPNYRFIVLLNVVVFALAGFLGLSFLVQTLNRLSLSQKKAVDTATASHKIPTITPANGGRPIGQPVPNVAAGTNVRSGLPGPLDSRKGEVIGARVRNVFGIWILVFGLVGAQMGWVLRPFVGSPNMPFSFFRARHSNFFAAVWETFIHVFS